MTESRGIYDTETGQYVDENDNPIGEPTVATIEERLAELEKQVPLQTEGLRRVTEGHYNGPAGSAAIVVELEGGQTTVNAQPDPH